MTTPNASGRAAVARPLILMPISTDGAPCPARGHIGDAHHVARVAASVEASVALSTRGGDAHAVPSADRR